MFQKHFKNILKCYKNGTLFTLFEMHFNAFWKHFIHDSVRKRKGTGDGEIWSCPSYYTVVNVMFPKRFQMVLYQFCNLVSKNAIFGKLKALSARGYMSHTLVLENLSAAKWSRYPWSTGLGAPGV